MRGVLAVRIFSLFAIICLISGGIMNFSNSDSEVMQQQYNERVGEEMTADADDSSLEEIFEEVPDQKSPNDKSIELIFLGVGGFSSLILGSLLSEVFKITVLVSLLLL